MGDTPSSAAVRALADLDQDRAAIQEWFDGLSRQEMEAVGVDLLQKAHAACAAGQDAERTAYGLAALKFVEMIAARLERAAG